MYRNGVIIQIFIVILFILWSVPTQALTPRHRAANLLREFDVNELLNQGYAYYTEPGKGTVLGFFFGKS